MTQEFNVFAILQNGRLQYEAILFTASFFAANPNFKGRLILGEPQPGPAWDDDPRVVIDSVRQLLLRLGAEIVPFDSEYFGSSYLPGNKIEGLKALPKKQPFVFFDTDTVFLDDITKVPFDFNRPMASMKRTNTWPQIELYGPGYTKIWKSLYDKFGLDFDASLDKSQPDEYWQRYLYFNAGWFFYKCPEEFGKWFTKYALEIRDDAPEDLLTQSLDPWLDQVALPLVISKLGGGRDTLPDGLLDGSVTCHYRYLALAYAREADLVVDTMERVLAPNYIKKVIKLHEPFRKIVFQRKGRMVRDMFDRNDLPPRENGLRSPIRKKKLWIR